jgi:hypothetical protein
VEARRLAAAGRDGNATSTAGSRHAGVEISRYEAALLRIGISPEDITAGKVMEACKQQVHWHFQFNNTNGSTGSRRASLRVSFIVLDCASGCCLFYNSL